MTKTLLPSDEDYYKIVTIHSIEKYDIDCTQLNIGDKVQCPSDKDMMVQKADQGMILILKKSVLDPFKKIEK